MNLLESIAHMLTGMDERRLRIVYHFVLHLTK